MNRWDAFTDDEMSRILNGLNLLLTIRVDTRADDLAQEVKAELERRGLTTEM